jgi:amino-acid N-acetyltransferase
LVKPGLRAAREEDAPGIRDLIHQVGINPMGLDWRRFTIAEDEGGRMIGCGQLKPHGREVIELASIAVIPEYQKQGIGRTIIVHLLENGSRPIYLMCRSELRTYYEKFGFQSIQHEEMPRYFQRIRKLLGVYEHLTGTEETVLVMKLQ